MNFIVAVLVAQLGAPEYSVRERAHSALVRLGPAAHVTLQLAERSTDMEVRVRARQIIDHWYCDNAAMLAATHGEPPWIADHPSLQDGLATHYLERARTQIGLHGPPTWKDYRLATRLLIEDLYRQRASRSEIAALIRDLAAAQIEWVTLHGHRFEPPIRPEDLPR